jgi:hypothetical protein
MRRFVSISWLSLLVIVASAAVLAVLPPVRLLVEAVRMGEDAPLGVRSMHLAQEVAKHPDDAQAWLALAVAAGYPPGSGPPNIKAFERAIELKPEWPAPYLALGARLVRGGPGVYRPELAALGPRFAEQERWQKKSLTAERRATLARAWEALQRARSLDPDNAAPDYLLAYIALQEHRDDDALALLRDGSGKNHWSVGAREASIAVYETAARRASPLHGAMFTMMTLAAPLSDANPQLRELARIATGMAVLAQQKGDPERAIFLRQSVMHLGEGMATDAYTALDAVVGISLWDIGGGERLTPAEAATAQAGLPAWKPDEGEQLAERRRDAFTRARVAKCAAYLRAHGRADLAEQVVSYSDELLAWLKGLTKAVRSPWFGPGSLVWALGACAAPIATAGLGLAWIGACGLAYLVLWALKRRPVPVVWARWKWGLVGLGCFGASALVALGPGGGRLSSPFSPWEPPAVAPWAVTCVIAGLPLLVVSALVITWRVRRRQEASARPGFVRQYVGTLTAVLLPVIALVMVTAAAGAVPAAREVERAMGHLNLMIYKSELAYYGLQPPTPPVSAPAARGKGRVDGQ